MGDLSNLGHGSHATLRLTSPKFGMKAQNIPTYIHTYIHTCIHPILHIYAHAMWFGTYMSGDHLFGGLADASPVPDAATQAGMGTLAGHAYLWLASYAFYGWPFKPMLVSELADAITEGTCDGVTSQ